MFGETDRRACAQMVLNYLDGDNSCLGYMADLILEKANNRDVSGLMEAILLRVDDLKIHYESQLKTASSYPDGERLVSVALTKHRVSMYGAGCEMEVS